MCGVKLDHYQPWVPAGDNNDSGEYENKDNKVVKGDHFRPVFYMYQFECILFDLTVNYLIVKHFL